jgi:hypothetical protein
MHSDKKNSNASTRIPSVEETTAVIAKELEQDAKASEILPQSNE